MTKFEVVETIDPPERYYRNQVKSSRGQWRDIAPYFVSRVEAVEAAKMLALDSGQSVRVVKFGEGLEENN